MGCFGLGFGFFWREREEVNVFNRHHRRHRRFFFFFLLFFLSLSLFFSLFVNRSYLMSLRGVRGLRRVVLPPRLGVVWLLLLLVHCGDGKKKKEGKKKHFSLFSFPVALPSFFFLLRQRREASLWSVFFS